MSQFIVKSGVLNGVLKRIEVVADTTLPAYAEVKCELVPGWLYLSTISRTINTEALIPVQSQTVGELTFGLGIGLLAEIAGSLPANVDVEFQLTDTDAVVRTGGSRFKLKLLNDACSIPSNNMSRSGRVLTELSIEKLLDGVTRVIHCHDDKSSGTYRCALCINCDHIVATDGYRLSLCPNKAFQLAEKENLILSVPLLEKLAKIYSGIDGTAGFGYDEGGVYIHAGGIYTATRRLALKYPEYRAVLPKSQCGSCVLSRKALVDSLKRALIVVGDKGIKQVDFTFAENRLLLATSGPAGDSAESIETGTPALGSVRLNGDYVLKALTKMESDKVTVEYRGALSSFVILDGEHLNVFQPINPG